MLDLTNYTEIQSAQSGRVGVKLEDLVAIANLDVDNTLNLDTIIKSIGTTNVVVEGDFGAINNKYIVIGHEIAFITNSSYSSPDTTFTIDREKFGTKADSFSLVGYPIRTINIFSRTDGWSYDNYSSSKESVFPFNLETGEVTILDDMKNWLSTSSEQIYKFRRNKTVVYLFKGFNGERLLKYVGFAYTSNSSKSKNTKTERVKIRFNDKFVLWYENNITDKTVLNGLYPRELLSAILNYDLSKIYYANGNIESDFEPSNYLLLSEYSTYGDILAEIAKSGIRFCFDELEKIKITSDIIQSNLVVSKTGITPSQTLDISLGEDEALVVNKITGNFYERQSLFNFADPLLNNKYVNHNASISSISHTLLGISDGKYYFNTLTVSNADLAETTDYDSLVILKDNINNLEFHGRVKQYGSGNAVTILIGNYDKDYFMNKFGRETYLDGLGYSLSRNFTLYYQRKEVAVIFKHSNEIDGEVKNSQLKIPLRPQVVGGTEWKLTTSAEFGSNSNSEVGEFTNFFENINSAYGTFTNTDLLYNREMDQFDNTKPPLFAISTQISSALGRGSDKFVTYDTFDNSDLQIEVLQSKDSDVNALINYKNTQTISSSSLIEITGYTQVTSRLIQISLAQYNSLNVGDVLILKEPTSPTAAEKYEYNVNKNTNWTIISLFENSGNYYFTLDGDIKNTFDFTVYPATSIVYLHEFYIMGNPVLEYVNPYEFVNQPSIEEHGEEEIAIDGKLLSLEAFAKAVNYYDNGFGAIDVNGSDRKFLIPLELRDNIELQKFDIIRFRDDVFSDIDENTDWMIMGTSEGGSKSGNKTIAYVMNLNNFDASETEVGLNTILDYAPLSTPKYNHQGNEGTQDEVLTDLSNTTTINATDIDYGDVKFRPIAILDLNASIISADDTLIVVGDVNANNSNYNNFLQETGRYRVIKVDNEYILTQIEAYTSGDANLRILKRGFVQSTQTQLIAGKEVQFNEIVTLNVDGTLFLESADMGDDNSYVKFNKSDGVMIKGDVTILSGSGFTKTFEQPSAPTNPTDNINTGDIWIDTSEDREEYFWDGTQWLKSKSQIDANDALEELWQISSDGVVTPDEKLISVQNWQAIANEKLSFDSKVSIYKLTTDVTYINYVASFNSLNNYLNIADITTSGTIGTVIGSPTITGLGTSFDTELTKGEQIRINGVVYEVAIIESATLLQLTSNSLHNGSFSLFKLPPLNSTTNNTEFPTVVTRATWDGFWTNYYENKIKLQNLINDHLSYTSVKIGNDAVDTGKDGFLVDTSGYANIKNSNNEIFFAPTGETSYIHIAKGGSEGELEVGNQSSNNFFSYNTSNGLTFKGRYFNETAYVSTKEELISALDISTPSDGYGGSNKFSYLNTNGLKIKKIIILNNINISGLTSSHFGLNNYIIPNSDVFEITSESDRSVELAMTNWGFRLNDQIALNNFTLTNLGSSNTIGGINYSIYIDSNTNVELNSLVFDNIVHQIFGNNQEEQRISNIIIEDYSDSILSIFNQCYNISSTLIKVTRNFVSTSSFAFARCRNIENITIESTALTTYRAFNCFNICSVTNNVSCVGNFRVLFEDCFLIENINADIQSSYAGAGQYLFQGCNNISNVFSVNGNDYGRWFNLSKYIINCQVATDPSYNSNIEFDTNNSWNEFWVTKTSSVSLQTHEDKVIVSASSIDLTLPTNQNGREYVIYNNSPGNITVNSSAFTIGAGVTAKFTYTGVLWIRLI